MSHFDWPTLIKNKDKEIARLEAAYRNTVQRAGGEIIDSRAVVEDAHTVRLLTDRRAYPRRFHPHRLRRPPDAAGNSRRWARHHLERGVRSGEIAAPDH